MGRLRLLLGDDHRILRHGLRKILEEKPEFQVVGEAGDGREAVKMAGALVPDVAILDIAMPLLNGIEATRQIVRRVPSCKVLILSMHADEPYIARALQAGARGYLLKDSASTDLLRAVSAVASGKAFFSAVISQAMIDDYVRRVADASIQDPVRDAVRARARDFSAHRRRA